MNDVERMTLKNGKPNPKYVDLLDEDPAIAGQRFSCMSFICPEDILKRREQYIFDEFVRQWDMRKSMDKFAEFLNFLSFKHNLNVETIFGDYNEFVKEEERLIKDKSSTTLDDFKNFLDKNEERLTQEFSRANSFQTSSRGIKNRGNFATQEEAEMNCKKLREKDPHHDIYVCATGVWCPLDINAYKTGKVEHLEPELNRLMHEKIKNEEKAKQDFDDRVKAAKRKAIEDNIAKAKLSGNKLTQTIDEDGNLVGANTINYEERDVADEEEASRLLKDVKERTAHAGDAAKTEPGLPSVAETKETDGDSDDNDSLPDLISD
jgi:hypothetical protein